MTTEVANLAAPTTSKLLGQVAVALALGTALTVFFILPAEYGVDPTGFGKLTGLVQMAEPREIVVETKVAAPPEIAKVEAIPYREDIVEIPIGALGESLGAVEYKVTLAKGETMVYSWTASAPIVFEFHGHTQRTDGSPVEVMDYIKGESAEGNGTLTAPIDGIHGWYFANPTFEGVTVQLKMAGFYRLEPGIIGIH